jgi:hypothetical protein
MVLGRHVSTAGIGLTCCTIEHAAAEHTLLAQIHTGEARRAYLHVILRRTNCYEGYFYAPGKLILFSWGGCQDKDQDITRIFTSCDWRYSLYHGCTAPVCALLSTRRGGSRQIGPAIPVKTRRAIWLDHVQPFRYAI